MALGLDVTFADDHIRFPGDHLSRIGGSFDGTLTVAAIQDADHGATPPEVRTVAWETLFVSAEQRGELEQFCQANDIPIRVRPDVWGDLLEPFVDSHLTLGHEAATLNRLQQAGLTAGHVADIRARVAPMMRAYNALHWDWYHLGLADLLDAATATWLPEDLRAEIGEISSFYRWAMAIGNQG